MHYMARMLSLASPDLRGPYGNPRQEGGLERQDKTAPFPAYKTVIWVGEEQESHSLRKTSCSLPHICNYAMEIT